MIKSRRILTIVALLMTVWMFGCGASTAVKGGAIGGASGAVVGGVIGHYAGNTVLGAIIGAAVGGTAGVLIGNYMDKQAEEMKEKLENAEIERVGEGIKIVFDSGILFSTNSSTLGADAKVNLGKLAQILLRYPNTNILVTGYTDNVGTQDYNQSLSERRAQAVLDYSASFGVAASRFSMVGFGENDPIASNLTEEGKHMNRRVEIGVFANEKLKSAAGSGALH